MGRLISLFTVTAIIFAVATIPNENVNAHNEWHVYEGDSIQDVVDDASAGDTIYVHAGTYVENVVINKSNINLICDDWKLVIVKAKKSDDHTFYLTADGIVITGFTVTGSYACGFGGICIENADNCKIINNNCSKNLCAGIFLKNSSNCEIRDNIVSDNDCGGIKITENSDQNIIKSNIIERNRNVGLEISKNSEDNLIYNNYFNNTGSYGKWGNVIDNVPWKNRWNATKRPSASIVSGSHLGGNYYSDYSGIDANGDGIGDTPYEIKNHVPHGEQSEVTNKDYLPLIKVKPVLSYNPKSYDFGNMPKNQAANITFEIWNSGTGTLNYTLSENCNWIDIDPIDGTSTGEHDTVTISIDTTGLSTGIHVCLINISSNGGEGVFTVKCDVSSPESTSGFQAMVVFIGMLIAVAIILNKRGK